MLSVKLIKLVQKADSDTDTEIDDECDPSYPKDTSESDFDMETESSELTNPQLQTSEPAIPQLQTADQQPPSLNSPTKIRKKNLTYENRTSAKDSD
ncbi:hypothetical protein RRG08_023937 [Elysia crispata]|uniref:Uncharacterized protein n=1 Tax=Elysia crispata TaxID=231223 RepID=A0AAE0YME7_9GAST|nr:hypothetical protein RRG08_023937 [Elysia crispata]